MYWMITNRKLTEKLEPTPFLGPLSYFISDGKGPLDQVSSWNLVDKKVFIDLLKRETSRFPLILDPEDSDQQKHLGVFIHGFNNSWGDAAKRYQGITDTIYKDKGLCILFSWPSDGTALGYYPDRIDARNSSDGVAQVFSDLYDWMVTKQADAVADPKKSCRAKISVIAHSMGNFVLQKGLKTLWSRKNQPLLASLINQLIMVAADVDADLFKSGENIDKSDGDAIANLTYRITALYTGRDTTLGVSAGLKHFGERRLGRSGLSRTSPIPSNVWDIDVTDLIDPDLKRVHSACFDEPKTIKVMQELLNGTDRGLIEREIAKMKPAPAVVG
ncbi:MAG: alpha/beta hydrolase [Acidobacteria bacterium]|nr:alpha/beta hydrolase [Acidobacteriota bacterium]